MKQTAGNMGVDLLLVDTGDLHDGTGLSDATKPDGAQSMPIFDEIPYDLLTIGMFFFFFLCHCRSRVIEERLLKSANPNLIFF